VHGLTENGVVDNETEDVVEDIAVAHHFCGPNRPMVGARCQLP
jgi:hypothetical protein